MWVLVASRRGATRHVGHEVAQVPARAGHTLDVLHPDGVAHVSGYGEAVLGYGAVVPGSAVYAGRWSPSAQPGDYGDVDQVARWVRGIARELEAPAGRPSACPGDRRSRYPDA